MPFCSFIVPVYKTEQELPRCVHSILNQTWPDFELILVDDGSPDSCPELCDQFAEADNRVKVIHQQNGGVSFARNRGIEKASGKYIWFVDSDDSITENALAQLAAATEKTAADLYVFNCKGVTNDFVGTFDDFMDRYYFTYVVGFSSWNKLYRTSVVREYHLLFDEQETIGEDLLFNLSYDYAILGKARHGHVLFLGQDYYTYDRRAGSAMNTNSGLRLEQQLRLYRKAKQMLSDVVSDNTLTYLFLLHLISGVNQAKCGSLHRQEFCLIDFSTYTFEIERVSVILGKFFLNEKASLAGRMRIRLFLRAMEKGNYSMAGRIMGLK